MHRLLFLLCICIITINVGCTKIMYVPESSETLHNWHLAREYQRQQRYELARQYYILALAGAREPQSQKTLQLEIKAVDRMIEAMR
ncbi:hypothetical protein BW722_01105 [Lawsonia intracellularis]|nr:hypothetical protein LAW_00212 [Lawsonia intracellularis N343]OMQ05949.1 hypothetical protein BW722_01105 [Lawsonia intracellularis]